MPPVPPHWEKVNRAIEASAGEVRGLEGGRFGQSAGRDGTKYHGSLKGMCPQPVNSRVRNLL